MKRTMLRSIVFIALCCPIASAQDVDESTFRALEFRAIGPAVMGGRIDDVEVNESNPSTMYVGAASGGVWKTTNNGVTWTPIFDDQGVASIGDIALAPSNPDIVWVGTGEPNNRQSSSFGDGVYKSVDGGRTWKHMGLRDSHHIGRVIIDPHNAEIVYVAALGHLWGSNRERGVFKTTDGGQTWTNVKFVNEDTGFVDMAMDPANSQTLYAAAYQRRRTAWGFNGGGTGGGLFKTTDGGRTWNKLSNGLPSGVVGRIGVTVARKNPSVVYTVVENRANGGLFRSEDRGETWQKVNTLNPRPMYYSHIFTDPSDENRVYLLSSSFYVSKDGGRTFLDPKTGRVGANTAMTGMYDVGVHGDHHSLWIDPKNPSHLVLGNDGGLYFTYDGTMSWDKVNNIPLAQFYEIGVDMKKPYTICGGLQDTHSWCGPSSTRRVFGIMNSDWQQIDFGDGMYAQPDPNDATTVYIEASGGSITRVNTVTGDRKPIKPAPKAGEPPYRFNWNPPIQISPHNSKTLYFGANRFFKSVDRGENWTVSADLTKAQDRDQFPIMGTLPSADTLSRHDGVSAWGTLTTIAESPVQANVIWVGSDDGSVQLSRDGGATWTSLSDRISGIAKDFSVRRIEPSHKEAGTAYLTLDRHQWDDFSPYVFVTADFGQTWKSIAAGLGETGWVNVVREHPKNQNVLLAGTETGLFISANRGARWTRLKNNLPTVPIDDLVIHPRDNDLILGTHGRAIYVLDDTTPMSALTSEVLSSASRLFEPRPATVQLAWKSESYVAQREFMGPNAPSGAILNYYLKAVPAGELKVTIVDAQNKVVRELAGNKNAGINRLIWDLRAAPPAGVANGRGPFVLPGKYTVKLSGAGPETTAVLTVDHDSQMPVSDAERRARFTFLTTINGIQATMQNATAALTSLNTGLTTLTENLKKVPTVPPAVTTAAAAALEQLRELQRKVGPSGGGGDGDEGGGGGGGLRGRINNLFTEIDGAQPTAPQQGTLTGPTTNQKQRLDEAITEWNAVLAELNNLITTKIPELNQQITRANIPVLPPLQRIP
jgi:photosystem II stability/assembly factor-like uncharacterized protein